MHSRSLPSAPEPTSLPLRRSRIACAVASFVAISVALTFLAACGDSEVAVEISPGVIFSYPVDGQMDIPVGSRIVVGFSEPIDEGALTQVCSEGEGGLCVIGPNGPVEGRARVAEGGGAVQFSGALVPGTTYQVWVQPSLLVAATNLSSTEPLFSFTTRSQRPRADLPPRLIAINGGPPETLGVGGLPLVDFATLRILFSEPVSIPSLVYGESVSLLDSAGALVDAVMVTDGLHLSIDPVADLDPGTTHRLQLSSGITDASGHAFAGFEHPFAPLDSRGAVGLTRQTLNVAPVGLLPSSHIGVPANAIEIEKPLLGQQQLAISPGAIAAELGDPSLFGGPIPITVRRGQELASTGLEINFSGEVPSNVETGTIGVRFVTDATGFLYRNPYRPADQIPEDEESPIFFELTFDIALFSSERQGNAIVSQNVLHVQTSGTAVVRDGNLIMETVGGLEVDILGVSTGDGNISLLLQADRARPLLAADTTPPGLVSTYPFAGQPAFDPSARPMLVFDEPVRDINAGVELVDANGSAVPVRFESHGAALLLSPLTPLEYGTDYELRLLAVTDLAGNVQPSAPAPIQFSTPPFLATNVPVALTALRPGVPCALQAGTCTGAGANDEAYGAFTIGPEEPVEGYFTQPVVASSLTLGTQCGVGSVRVEQLDANGVCVGVVGGALSAFERRFRFVPDEIWQASSRYRLTVVGGGNGSCDAGEVCGENGGPLNTDVLSGSQSPGGPTIEIPFEVNQADYPGAYIPIELTPATDVNGSGFVALGNEILRPENRVVFDIVSTSGIVSDARFTDADCLPESPQVEGCIYLSGTVPILLEEAKTNCTIATGPTGPIVADTCAPLILTPQIFFGTSANLEADALLLTPSVTLGQVVLRILERPGEPTRAFIYEANGETRLGGDIDLYVDAPSLDISIPGSGHDLRSRLLTIPLDGPVTFFDDGRVRINMSNTIPIDLSVAVDFLGIGLGGIDLQIPPNGLTLQLVSPLIRSGDPGSSPQVP